MVEVAFNVVQQAVHQRQTAGAGHQFKADKRAVDLEILGVAVEIVQIVSLRLHVAIRFNQEARRTCSRILHHFARLRLQQMDNGFNQRTRSEVLARAGFGFVSVLLQQPFVHIAEVVSGLPVVAVVPVQRVHIADQLSQLFGLLNGGTDIMEHRLHQLFLISA